MDRAGSGVDGDVQAVKIYADNGDHVFDPATDTLITSGLDTFTSGSAIMTLSTQTISTSTQTYWLVYDVSASASAGKTLGASITSSGFFTIVSPSVMGLANFPFVSGLMNITPTIDTMTVVPTNLAPGMTQGDANKALGKIVVSASGHAVVWSSLRLDRTGGVDSDISAVSIYADDGDGVFSASSDTLVTSGSNFFSNGSAFINFTVPQTIATGAKTYFLVVSLSTTCTFGDTLQFTAQDPKLCAGCGTETRGAHQSSRSLFTSGGNINKLADVMSIALSTAATGELYQGTAKYALSTLTLKAARQEVFLSQLKLSQYGTGVDSDITTLYLYADNGSGVFDPVNDASAATSVTVSGGVATFAFPTPLLVSNSSQTYYVVADISVGARIGDTLGFRIPSTAGTLVVAPDSISSAGIPTQSPLATVLDPHVPRMPIITITSAYSASPTRLSASWSSSVPQGSIVLYDYAIGTTPGGTDVVPFTPSAWRHPSRRIIYS